MKRMLGLILFGSIVFVGGYSLRPIEFSAEAAGAAAGRLAAARGQARGDFKLSDIGKFEWVDKRCRMWARDGDIDVDQACLVVKTIRGGLVVIPNQYNDEWLQEIGSAKASDDKWLQRFFSIGGGVKPR